MSRSRLFYSFLNFCFLGVKMSPTLEGKLRLQWRCSLSSGSGLRFCLTAPWIMVQQYLGVTLFLEPLRWQSKGCLGWCANVRSWRDGGDNQALGHHLNVVVMVTRAIKEIKVSWIYTTHHKVQHYMTPIMWKVSYLSKCLLLLLWQNISWVKQLKGERFCLSSQFSSSWWGSSWQQRLVMWHLRRRREQ